MGGKEGVCAMCDREIDERDDVVVITKEPGKKANYYEPEVLGVVCPVCWNGGTDAEVRARRVKLTKDGKEFAKSLELEEPVKRALKKVLGEEG